MKTLIEILISSTYQNFLKKVYCLTHNFIEETKNKTMQKFSKERLLTIVAAVADELMTKNGFTTTLDVKNEIRNRWAGYDVRQDEVHGAMDVNYSIQGGAWDRENITTQGAYFKYSFYVAPPVVDEEEEEETIIANVVPTSAPTSTSKLPTSINVVVFDASKTYKLQPGALTLLLLEKVEPTQKILYSKGKDDYTLINTTSFAEGRKVFKTVVDTPHNDVRGINVSTYLKRAK